MRVSSDLLWSSLALSAAALGFCAGALSSRGVAAAKPPGAGEAQRAKLQVSERGSGAGDANSQSRDSPGRDSPDRDFEAQGPEAEEPAAREPGARDEVPPGPGSGAGGLERAAQAPCARRAFLRGPVPQPVISIPLDPLADQLTRLLIRIRGLEQGFVPPRLLQDLQEQAAPRARRALLLALTAYFPEQVEWPPDLPVSAEYVYARHLYCLAESEDPARRYQLLRALEGCEPGVLDPAWLEALWRTHAEEGIFDESLARLEPERAARVFRARGEGLSARQGESLARGFAARDPRRGAAVALEHFMRSWEPRLLALARRWDPAAVAAFARRRGRDPRWISAETLLELEASCARAHDLERLEDWYQHLALARRAQRRILSGQRAELLELISWGDSWTPLQEQVVGELLSAGDEDSTGFLEGSVELRLVGLTRGRTPFGEVQRDALEQDAVGRPFAFRAQLEAFLRLVPRLEAEEVLSYAARFQRQGDAEAARRVLDRAPAGADLSEAKSVLASEQSLEDFLERFRTSGR